MTRKTKYQTFIVKIAASLLLFFIIALCTTLLSPSRAYALLEGQTTGGSNCLVNGKPVACKNYGKGTDPAANGQVPGSDLKCGSQKCGIIQKYINPFINLLAAAVGVIVALSIIIGAIQFSSSAGDPQKAAAGKQRITNALLALVAFIFLYAFLQFLVPGGFLNNG